MTIGYDKIVRGIFRSRPNRFIAYVEIDGILEKCHVKNTGRCKELLIDGVEVFLSVSDNPNRSTKYDLVTVRKGNRLINIDSQIPNDTVAHYLKKIPLFSSVTYIKREYRYGNSRIDIYAEDSENKYLIEVKGVTLEIDDKVMFPDAPTERGRKHILELIESQKDGYIPCIVFLIQMNDVESFSPNDTTDPEFSDALRLAKKSGVNIFAYDSKVTEDSIEMGGPVPVIL